jgi:hypothetical protein
MFAEAQRAPPRREDNGFLKLSALVGYSTG